MTDLATQVRDILGIPNETRIVVEIEHDPVAFAAEPADCHHADHNHPADVHVDWWGTIYNPTSDVEARDLWPYEEAFCLASAAEMIAEILADPQLWPGYHGSTSILVRVNAAALIHSLPHAA